MKRIKHLFLLTLLLVLIFVPRTYADDFIARYLIDIDNGRYDADAQTYTVDVYLDTSEYLTVGTFGVKYNNIDAVFTLDSTNFSLFNDFSNAEENYTAVQWYINDIDPVTGKLLLGTITVSGVTLGDNNSPLGWTDNTISLLDWYTTPESAEEKFVIDEYGVCLNDEIFRSVEGEDVPGYYQGYDMQDEDDPKWVDIGFGPPDTGITVSGNVNSYNKNNKVKASLYRVGETTPYKQAEANDLQFGKKGEVSSRYGIKNVQAGTYRLVISKSVHLTYETEITVTEDGLIVDDVTLICGDIQADERIDFNDRAELMRFFNRQKLWDGGDEFLKSDLNGDEMVNAFDLELLKSNYMKTY